MTDRACLSLLTATMFTGAACSSTSVTPASVTHGDPRTWSVRTAGPLGCGHRALETSYTPPAGLPVRRIPVEVWYPTETTEGEHPVYVFRDNIALNDVEPAAPAFASGTPVLVHSHGLMGLPGSSARLMCHFASHGWNAVAPKHVGDTLPAQVAAMSSDFSEPRMKSLTLMAGAPRSFFVAGGYDAVTVPVLMMSGTLNTVSDDKIMDTVTRLDIGWATVEGGCHQLFGLGDTCSATAAARCCRTKRALPS